MTRTHRRASQPTARQHPACDVHLAPGGDLALCRLEAPPSCTALPRSNAAEPLSLGEHHQRMHQQNTAYKRGRGLLVRKTLAGLRCSSEVRLGAGVVEVVGQGRGQGMKIGESDERVL